MVGAGHGARPTPAELAVSLSASAGSAWAALGGGGVAVPAVLLGLGRRYGKPQLVRGALPLSQRWSGRLLLLLLLLVAVVGVVVVVGGGRVTVGPARRWRVSAEGLDRLGLARLQQILVPQLADGLGEVHLDAAVVDEHVVHLLVGLHAGGLGFELDEGEVQGVPCLVIADHLAGLDGSEPREYQLEVFVGGHGVELADEQHLVRGLHLGVREVSGHLQHDRPGLGLLPFYLQLRFFFVYC